MEEKEYICATCNKTGRSGSANIPGCCGNLMIEKEKYDLDNCTKASDAEHHRSFDNDEACDDARSGS